MSRVRVATFQYFLRKVQSYRDFEDQVSGLVETASESREKGSVLPLRDSLRSREVAERCEIIPLPE